MERSYRFVGTSGAGRRGIGRKRTVNVAINNALTDYLPLILCEAVLGVAACVLFLGSTWRGGRNLWGGAALIALVLAAIGLAYTAFEYPTIEAKAEANAKTELNNGGAEQAAQIRADVYASPVSNSRLALFLKVLALAGGFVLVLTSWNEVSDRLAAEYHACVLLMTAGLCLTGAANDLITLFLALELISIPTYILLYLPRSDQRAQESAMKYFLLSIFSSALLLFGFSYLYGVAGTTNLTALSEALTRPAAATGGLALTAMVLVTAGLGFKITAVPFHFYADVYQGTTPAAAAILAFVPKVAGFAALIRVFGFTIGLVGTPQVFVGQMLEGQGLKLLWILAAVTMTLGNVLALLQNDLKRLLAYSSVAHAGYMLVGLAAAPLLYPRAGGRRRGRGLLPRGLRRHDHRHFRGDYLSEHSAKAGRDGGRPGRFERYAPRHGVVAGVVLVQPDRYAADRGLLGQAPVDLRRHGRSARLGRVWRIAVVAVVYHTRADYGGERGHRRLVLLTRRGGDVPAHATATAQAGTVWAGACRGLDMRLRDAGGRNLSAAVAASRANGSSRPGSCRFSCPACG